MDTVKKAKRALQDPESKEEITYIGKHFGLMFIIKAIVVLVMMISIYLFITTII